MNPGAARPHLVITSLTGLCHKSQHTVESVTTCKLLCEDVIHECLGLPACLDVPAGHPSPSVNYGCASVSWQFPPTFGIPAPSSWAQDSVLFSPPHQGPGQIIKQEKCYLVGYKKCISLKCLRNAKYTMVYNKKCNMGPLWTEFSLNFHFKHLRMMMVCI